MFFFSFFSNFKVSAKLQVWHDRKFYSRHSLVRAKVEVFVLLYVFLFVRSTISRQTAGRFTPKFAFGRTLVPDVSSPLLGVSGPQGAEKGGNEIFVTIGVNGEFLHFGGFWATRGRIHTKFYMCRDNVCRRAPSPSGVHRPEWRVCVSSTDALVVCKLTFYILTKRSDRTVRWLLGCNVFKDTCFSDDNLPINTWCIWRRHKVWILVLTLKYDT